MFNNLLFIGLSALVLGFAIGYFLKHYLITKLSEEKRNQADRMLAEAEKKSAQIVKEAQERALEINQSAEDEASRRRTELSDRVHWIKKPTISRRCIKKPPWNWNALAN